MTGPEQGDTRKICRLTVKYLDITPTIFDCSLADHQIGKSKTFILLEGQYLSKILSRLYMKLRGRNQSHHSCHNFISRVFIGTLKNPNQFHQDFSVNNGGLPGSVVIYYILRNLKLLQVTCVKRRTRTFVSREIDMSMTSHLQQSLRQIQTLDLVFPTFLIVWLHNA